MAFTRFRPEIWSAQFLVAFRKALVYAGPTVVNRNYEGEIKQKGDKVRVTSISRPTVGDYVPGTPLVRETLTDAQRTLEITQAKYFDFEIDDVDKAQAAGPIMPQAMSEAAYAMADVADQYVASLYTQASAANALGTISVTTSSPNDFYDKVLVPLSVKLDEANVPTQGRYIVVPPWLYGRGQRDDRLVRVDASGSDQTLRNGIVARAAGFDILKSNNVPLVTGDDYAVTAGVSQAISFAEQLSEVEAFRPEAAFSDAVKGLTLYGAKVMRPDALATAIVSQT